MYLSVNSLMFTT